MAYDATWGGPIEAAWKLRIQGRTYADVVDALRESDPECATLDEETVRAWAQSGRLSWDAQARLVREMRAEELPQAANPEDAPRLGEIRDLIDKLNATLMGKAEGFRAEDLADMKIRPDTLLMKLYAEERMLTRSDVLGIPRRSLKKVVLLALEKLVGVLVRRGLVSRERITGEAAEISAEVMKELPDVLAAATAKEAVRAR